MPEEVARRIRVSVTPHHPEWALHTLYDKSKHSIKSTKNQIYGKTTAWASRLSLADSSCFAKHSCMGVLISRQRLAWKLAVSTLFVLTTTRVIASCGSDDAPAASVDAGPDSQRAFDGGTPETPETSAPDAPSTVVSPIGSRPTSVACPSSSRLAGDVDAAVDGGACAGDHDCDGGVEGRCNDRWLASGGSPSPGLPACSYHRCSQDQDCPGTTSVCGCGIGWAGQNLCLTNSNCRTDSNCPTGQRCVYSDPPILRYGDTVENGNEVGGPNYAGDAIGYFCTTPQDDCDCSDADEIRCIYNLNSKHWQCGHQP